MSAQKITTTNPTLGAAIRALAVRCDHALSEDGQGFNKPDTWAGHALAAREESEWLVVEKRLAWELLRKYRGQLASYGIDYDRIPEPADLPDQAKTEYHHQRREYEARQKREAEERNAEAARREREAQSRKISLTAAGDFRLDFLYQAEIVALLKGLPHHMRTWNGLCWLLKPERPAAELIRILVSEYGFNLDEAAERALHAALTKAEQPRYPGKIELTGKTSPMLKVSFDYDPAKVEKIKGLPHGDRKWDAGAKCWLVSIQHLATLRAWWPSFYCDPKAVEAGQEVVEAARYREEAAKRPAIEIAEVNFGAALPNGRTLYAHQREGIKWLLARRAGILADDMGLGKTLQALLAARCYQQAIPDLQIVVICPASLRENWQREAQMAGCSLTTYSWAKMPPAIKGSYFLICDEAHYAQTLKAQRTQGMLALAEAAAGCVLLTGTPIKNGRPVNLYPLLLACKHPLAYPAAQKKREYERYYCAARATRFCPWDTSGAAHLDELHERTKDAILRRLKKDCLDLPPKTRVIRDAELSSKDEQTYNEKLRELQGEYRRRLAAGEIEPNDALVLLNHLRHAGSLGKIGTAIELAEEVLGEDLQPVIFTDFQASAHEIARHFETEALTGDTPVHKRQGLVDEFQAGRKKVFVSTIRAGGVGITLTAGSTVIMVDRPWTPGDAEQAEDRCNRIGQTLPVTAIWLQHGEIDRKVDEILLAKQERIELVLQGKRKTMRGTGSPSEIARDMAALLFD